MSQAELAGRRVLVVDDETYVAMMIEDMLVDLGCEIAGVAQSLKDGLALAERTAFDIAILDVNLAGERVTPLAQSLARRAIPFVFSTGYGGAGLEPEWRGRPVLAKPFAAANLRQALSAALAPP